MELSKYYSLEKINELGYILQIYKERINGEYSDIAKMLAISTNVYAELGNVSPHELKDIFSEALRMYYESYGKKNN